VATALEYAIGPSNGHPAVPLPEAVANASEAIEAQVRANTDRIGELAELTSSIEENLSVSTLRHKEASIAVRTRVDELVAALRRHEEATLATIERDGEILRRELEARRSTIRGYSDALTRANNVLQDSVPPRASAAGSSESEATSGSSDAAAGDEDRVTPPKSTPAGGVPPADVDVLCALATAKEIVSATTHFDFPDDNAFALQALPVASAEELAVLECRTASLFFRPESLVGARKGSEAGDNEPAPIPALPQRPDEEVSNHPRRGAQADSAAPGIVRAFALGAAAGVDRRDLANPLDGDDAPLDVFANVPVTGGELHVFGSESLFVPSATRDFCRLAPLKGGCLWWDFGENRGAAIDEYTLLHGGATSWGALRAWSVVATNEMPPAVSAVDLEDEAEATAAALDAFFSEHCTVLDRRVKDSRLGAAPFNAVSFTVGNHAAARQYHRFIGVRIDGANASGHLNLLLSGAEWYGSIRARHH
jgi:hypothetical protein